MSGLGLRAKRVDGFTLLELLLALSITSLIGVVLSSMLTLAHRAWDRGQEIAQQNQEMRFVYSHLLLELKCAYPLKGQVDEEWTMAFVGERDRVFFLSTLGSLVSDTPDTGLREVGVYVDDDPSTDEQGLVLWEKPLDGQKLFDESEGSIVELDPTVTGVDLRYFYVPPQIAEGETVEGEWVDQWKVSVELENNPEMAEEDQQALLSDLARRSLPAAVEVTLTVARDDGRGHRTEQTMPPIIAPVFGGQVVQLGT